MGWFDNEQGSERQPPSPQPTKEPMPRSTPPKNPSPKPEPVEGGGSTLGREIHVDGTIVCNEDLTILGKVEGTIRAKGTLTIAREADVRAAIDGQRVIVMGEVEGDVEGAERVVLGPAARLDGNIKAPALEISEGAYFKGNVDMQPSSGAKGAQADKSSRSSGGDEKARVSGMPGTKPMDDKDKDKGKDKEKAESSGSQGGSSGADGSGGSMKPEPAGAAKTKGAETTASR